MRYCDFAPTAFDPKGLGLDDRQDWVVVPVTLTRDSGIMEESNFEAALAMLGDESDTCEVHRFGHWGPGWFEIILLHPSREAEVDEIQAMLDDCPVLDEADHSEREFRAIMKTWDCMSMWDRIEFAVENGHSIFAARRDNPFDCNNASGEAVYRLIRE